MTSNIRVVEYTEPGMAPCSLVMRPIPALRLSRKLWQLKIPCSVSDMDGMQLATAKEIDALMRKIQSQYGDKTKAQDE
jgi:hypothetical protein